VSVVDHIENHVNGMIIEHQLTDEQVLQLFERFKNMEKIYVKD